MTPDDGELLRRYASAREEAAFAELVRRHVGMVYHCALRQLGADAHAAEDVVQGVFLSLHRKAPSLHRHSSVAGWLHTTTRLKVSETLRAARRRRHYEMEASAMHELPEPSPEWTRLRPFLDQALGRLGDPDREAVLLRYFEGCTFPELGRRLHLSEDAARKRVDRSVGRLRAALHRLGVASTADVLGQLLAQEACAAPPVHLSEQILGAAATAPTAFSTASLITTMSTAKTIAATVAAAALIAAGVYAVREALAAQSAEIALTDANAGHDRLLDRFRNLRSQVQRAQSDAAVAENPLAARRAGAPPSAQPTEADFEKSKEYLDAHPAVRVALVARSRARALARYGDLFRSLNLTPDQITQFENILQQGEGLGADGIQLFVGDRLSSSAEMAQQFQALLGDADYAQLVEYVRAMPTDQLMHDLAAALYETSAPLTAAQSAQLLRTVDGSQTAAAPGALKPGDIPWDTLMAEASAALSPVQLKALSDLHEQARFQAAIRQALSTPP